MVGPGQAGVCPAFVMTSVRIPERYIWNSSSINHGGNFSCAATWHAFRILVRTTAPSFFTTISRAPYWENAVEIRSSFHPRLIELSAHYHFAPRPCQGARPANQKGRVERAIPLCPAIRSGAGPKPFTTVWAELAIGQA